MKIAVAGFQHETNRFSPIPTTLADFEKADGWPGLTAGTALLEVFTPMNIPLGGFLRYANPRHQIVPILWASAEPGGLVEDVAFDEITERMMTQIERVQPVDAIYLDLHGAMVTASHDDGEGELLVRLRRRFGRQLPVAVSLDLHANVTQKMIELTDVMTIFRTYPHLDMAATGFRAGMLLDEIFAYGHAPFCCYRKVPIIVPLQSQSTELEPCRSLYRSISEDQSLHNVHADIAMGFPPSDMADMGPGIVAYSFSELQANEKARQIARAFLDAEDLFSAPLYSEDEAITRALDCYKGDKPVLLADIQDNSGARATSDSTGLLHALVRHEVRDCVLAALCDPVVVRQAHGLGFGQVFQCELGGRFQGAQSPPYPGSFKVCALSDGRFKYHGEMMRGGTANIGPAAALQLLHTDTEMIVVVTSERIQCLDQAIISHLGIEPAKTALLAIKSTVHFRADFTPLVETIILVESPGFNPCRFTLDMLPRLRSGVRIL